MSHEITAYLSNFDLFFYLIVNIIQDYFQNTVDNLFTPNIHNYYKYQ